MVLEQAVWSALGNLPISERDIICSALFDGDSVVAWTVEDLSPADVPYRHSFELKDYQPISYPLRRMPLNHNQIVKKDV